jgi:hypothetical protein
LAISVLLILIDKTPDHDQVSAPADHIRTVWHGSGLSFGGDALRDHH